MFVIDDYPDISMSFPLGKPDRMGRIFTIDAFINSINLERIRKKSIFVVNHDDGIDLSNGYVDNRYIAGYIQGFTRSGDDLNISWRITSPIATGGAILTADNIDRYRIAPSGAGMVDSFTGNVVFYRLMGFILLEKL